MLIPYITTSAAFGRLFPPFPENIASGASFSKKINFFFTVLYTCRFEVMNRLNKKHQFNNPYFVTPSNRARKELLE